MVVWGSWGALLLGVPEWLCTWAILGAKVTTSKSIVFPAKDRPAGHPLFVREFWRTLFLQSGTPSWFSDFLWVFCTYTREWRWRRSWRRYHFKCFEDHMCDLQNWISARKSSKIFWRFYMVWRSNMRRILKHFWPGHTWYSQFGDHIYAEICGWE